MFFFRDGRGANKRNESDVTYRNIKKKIRTQQDNVTGEKIFHVLRKYVKIKEALELIKGWVNQTVHNPTLS